MSSKQEHLERQRVSPGQRDRFGQQRAIGSQANEQPGIGSPSFKITSTGAISKVGSNQASSSTEINQHYIGTYASSKKSENNNINIDVDSPQPVTTRPTKLVFGLSSKTNKLKHDEYAVRRSSSPIPFVSTSDASKSIDSSTRIQNQLVNICQQKRPTAQIESSISANAIFPNKSNRKGMVADDKSTSSSVKCDPSTNQSEGKVKSDSSVVSDSGRERGVAVKNRSISSDRVRKSSPTKRTPIEINNVYEPQLSNQQSKEMKDTEPNLVDNKSSLPAVKMQFNIPPPPQSKISGNKSSLVSYAKSRIYNKPSTRGTVSSVGQQDRLPDAIVSGFKPPKQVNVSKARERWEGGEPFAKCKSRQRLALAQAGKRLQLHGIWSATSVVANQQLQLQQAYSQSIMPKISSISTPDSSMKVLSRGSVLERVQQFEKAPSDIELEAIDDLASDSRFDRSLPTNTKRDSDSVTSSIVSESITTGSGSSSLPDSTLTGIKTPSQSPASSPSARTAEQRRLSFRRRSSASLGSTSSYVIPRFYHPNGKPNTYELELHKRNIVACFDKFPNRKASLLANAYKRHFNAIALACGFSEYFKEPLYLYVVEKEKLWSAPNGLRKQFSLDRSASFKANGDSENNKGSVRPNIVASQAIKASSGSPLSRSASIDGSNSKKIQETEKIIPKDEIKCNHDSISCDQYLICWRHLIEKAFDNVARFIHLLTFGQRNYLLPEDFIPLVQSIIDDHPGLKFLRAAPDFHMRYIQTVIARIYFSINRSWTGKISQNELRRSNFLAVLERLSQTEDINKITDYFSYEHFYVIYCKFWSLDQDHDLLISKEDLARHNDASISSRIIERIFMGIVSRHIQETGKMSYTDFVWFLMAEEDKKHPRSIEYWFRLMDMDGDGYISMYEMEYFYYEQVKRLELMNIEALPFLDCACQILDLINPKKKNKISLSDLKRTKMVTIFYDTFINLEKYLEHESREFVSTRDVVIDGVIVSDWERYASEEYESLVREETTV